MNLNDMGLYYVILDGLQTASYVVGAASLAAIAGVALWLVRHIYYKRDRG